MIHKLFVYKLDYYNLSNPSIKKSMMSDSQWYHLNLCLSESYKVITFFI